MLNPIDTVVRWLCVVLLCTTAVGWGCAYKWKGERDSKGADTKIAQNNEAQARQGAADASKGQDMAIDLANACAAEDARVQAENDRAVQAAHAAGVEEGKRAEKYYSDLANAGGEGDECAAITQVQVCEALYPY